MPSPKVAHSFPTTARQAGEGVLLWPLSQEAGEADSAAKAPQGGFPVGLTGKGKAPHCWYASSSCFPYLTGAVESPPH